MQRRFIRKELETYAVETSSLFESAVEVAIGNCLRSRGKSRTKLWKKRPMHERLISKQEAISVKRAMIENAPWTPWHEGRGTRAT